MSPKKDALTLAQETAPAAPFHLKRGETSGLTVYEETVSVLNPLMQQVRETGANHIKAKLALGLGFALIRKRGRGELAMLKRLTTGATPQFGVRWSKSAIDRALEMFDKFLRDVGMKKDALPEMEGTLTLDLFAKPPPGSAGELMARMMEWAETDRADEVSHEQQLNADAKLTRPLPPAGPRGGDEDEEEDEIAKREQLAKDALGKLGDLELWYESEGWQCLDVDGLERLRVVAGKFHIEAPKLAKKRRA